MANTYTQIHIHAVFAVQNRLSLIHPSFKDELYKYIAGIIRNHDHKLLVINGMPDHVHILFGFRPTQSLSDLMQDIKGSSSKWINEKNLVKGKFSWQQGYGAFAVGYKDLNKVTAYIQNQEEHHQQKNFMEEYLNFLKENDITFDEKYIFKPVN